MRIPVFPIWSDDSTSQSSSEGNDIVCPPPWQRAQRVSMGKDVTIPVVAITMAAATRRAGNVYVHQAGPGPTARKVSVQNGERSHTGDENVVITLIRTQLEHFGKNNQMWDHTVLMTVFSFLSRMPLRVLWSRLSPALPVSERSHL